MFHPRKKFFIKPTIFLFLFFLFSSHLYSQDARALLMEPVVRVVFNSEDPLSYSFGVAHRGLLLEVYDEQKKAGYSTEHLEFNHFTQYRLSESSALQLRLRYRINSWFNPERSNESRIIQQYTHANPDAFLNLWHRMRFEQRLEKSLTVFRGRYRIGISRPLSSEFAVGASTEALYSVSSKLKPQPEQRFMLSLDNTSFDNLGLTLGLEYRLDRYNSDPIKQYFIYTSATIYL